ncbi:MAG: hypothetical protein ACR2NG_04650, partial [Acidimicrobiia bacterium]
MSPNRIVVVGRLLLFSVGFGMVFASCGVGPMSETEYVESLNALVVAAGSDLEAAQEDYEQITDPTLEAFVEFVEQQLAVEYIVRDQFDSFDPPPSIDGVNQIMVDALHRIIAVAETLVDAAGTVGTLEELERTPEFSAYHMVNDDADSMCPEVQAEFDTLSARPVMDTPWLADLQLTARALLDCDDP